MAPTKYFIVQKRGTEYNDEGYTFNEEGGTPVKVFTTYKAAQDAKEELEAKYLSELRICDYAYSLDDASSHGFDVVNSTLNKLGLKQFKANTTLYEHGDLPKLTKKQGIELTQLFDRLKFYEIVEVDGE